MNDQSKQPTPAPDWRKTLDDAEAIRIRLAEMLERVERERSLWRGKIRTSRLVFVAVAVAIVLIALFLYLSEDARSQAMGAGVLGGLISGVLILFSQRFRPLEDAMKGFDEQEATVRSLMKKLEDRLRELADAAAARLRGPH